jgi:hypothetical protein
MRAGDREQQGSEGGEREVEAAGAGEAGPMRTLIDRFGVAGAQRIIQRKVAQRRAAEAAQAAPAQPPAEKGAGAPLPGPVRAKMEAAFGADLADVRVHQDERAAAMGAQAYAEGPNLHFAPGQYDPHGAAGQELLGHELAHVVQQRAGRVAAGPQAKGGTPVVEDAALESEADAVGARAARGEAAGIAAGGTQIARPVVQGYFKIKREDFAGRKVTAAEDTRFSAQEKVGEGESYLKEDGTTNIVRAALAQIAGLRISGDGKLAMEDGGGGSRQSKSFFIDPTMIDGCNANLEKAGSHYRLEAAGGRLTLPDAKGGAHALVEVIGVNVKSKHKGDALDGPVNCDEMGGAVAGWGQDANKRLLLEGQAAKDTPRWENEEGHRAAAYVNEYGKRKDDWTGKRSGAAKASQYAQPTKGAPIESKTYTIRVTTDSVDDLRKLFVAVKINWNACAVDDKSGTVTASVSELQREQLVAKRDEGGAHVTAVETIAEVPLKQDSGPLGLAAALADQRDQIAQEYGTMPDAKKDEVAERLGVNQFAKPAVGDAFVTFATGAKRNEGGVSDPKGKVTDFASGTKVDAKWGQHWGGVVAKSSDGADYVTLENYDRQGEDQDNVEAARKVAASDTRAFFGMYGSETGTTWHDAMKASGEFPNPVSLAYRNKDRKA